MLLHYLTVFFFPGIALSVTGLTIKRDSIIKRGERRYREVESEKSWRFDLDKSHVGTMLTGLWDHRDVPSIIHPRVHAGHISLGEITVCIRILNSE